MTTEIYVTQANAERFLKAYFGDHGKLDSRNFNYLLNESAAGETSKPHSFRKGSGTHSLPHSYFHRSGFAFSGDV
jgi:hypothetical protein